MSGLLIVKCSYTAIYRPEHDRQIKSSAVNPFKKKKIEIKNVSS